MRFEKLRSEGQFMVSNFSFPLLDQRLGKNEGWNEKELLRLI